MIAPYTTDIERRALVAYYSRKCEGRFEVIAREVLREGKKYCAIMKDGKYIELYRVRNDGMLKYMRRWPKGMEVLK